MRTIEFRPRASVDLDGILVYIALTLKSPQAARNTADAIFAAIERAAELTVRRVFHTMQDTDCYGFELLDD